MSTTLPVPGNRVLLIEDDVKLRTMLSQALGDMGFSTHGVGSGEAALRHMDGAAADIALLDLNLPGMGGLEVFEALRAKHPRLAVIVLTGFGQLRDAQHAIRLDVTDFLLKPVSLGDLERSLGRARAKTLPRLSDALTPEPALAAVVSKENRSVDFAEPPVTLEALEKQHILCCLLRHEGNRAATAAELGISLRTLYYRLEQYGATE